MPAHSSHSSSKAASLLNLPPEIRREIFIHLFRSTTLCMGPGCPARDPDDWEHRLAVPWTCRQIYSEATPLVLPNVRLYCRGNDAMMNTLTLIGPERISQLRHLILSHIPIGFRLDPSAEGLQDEDGGMRFFHAGSLLGLFPGLRLDLLEVFCGVGGGPYTGNQTTDCFGSLLEADGYRRLWMHATTGDSDAWIHTTSVEDTWREAIDRKFRPNTGSGWKIQIRLQSWEWDERERDSLWTSARDAGITLVQPVEQDDYNYGREDSEGHLCEEHADIIVDRGDGVDSSVKQGDDSVLKCIQLDEDGDTPESFKKASDALRKLFRENSWESIKAMDGYDDGTVNTWHEGDRAYYLMY
ncbi:uncharacterized protein DNG_03187 [Cephalotrichum gorgonifer]|uniref:Uncharacterized protein n=1 Tax=Cephalotrichum gorgonifer TaxID=2041049 RepID=A0AAE8MUE1_9PEZI|nr:uncharacterized protein DNG_03187 [Cephalotrichum gorgonifer]